MYLQCFHNNVDWPAWITAIATFGGVALAVLGFNAWKKQLRGKNDYELARRYLRAVYKTRNGIRGVRNPSIPIEEMLSALKEKGFSEDDIKDTKKTDWAVYALRWERVREGLVDLDVEALDAEVSWGREAVTILSDLRRLMGKLHINLGNFLKKDKDFKTDRGILYGEEGDAFDLEVQGAVSKIENYLRLHLK